MCGSFADIFSFQVILGLPVLTTGSIIIQQAQTHAFILLYNVSESASRSSHIANNLVLVGKEKGAPHAYPFSVRYLCAVSHTHRVLLLLLALLSESVFQRVNSRQERSWYRFAVHRQTLPFSASTLLMIRLGSLKRTHFIFLLQGMYE